VDVNHCLFSDTQTKWYTGNIIFAEIADTLVNMAERVNAYEVKEEQKFHFLLPISFYFLL
jgi:hypothetical protein